MLDALVRVLLVPDRSRLVLKLTASLLLTEIAPSAHINLSGGNLAWNDSQIPFIVPVILSLVSFLLSLSSLLRECHSK